jgi:hypothetical protein
MVAMIVSRLVGFAKWPAAVVVTACTPALAIGLWELLVVAYDSKALLGPFYLALAATLLAWPYLRRFQTVQFWCTLEHELTHALFAYATLVPVSELKVSHHRLVRIDDNTLAKVEMHEADGHVMLGGSNWLVGLGPYFFPTAPFALLLALWALANEPTGLARVLLGVATGFTLVSTLQELHPRQPDLEQEGLFYCALLLPGLNLGMYSMLCAYESGGWALVLQLLRGLSATTLGALGFS